MGAALGTILVGYLGETIGWAWGFGIAGIGMVLGLAIFVAGRSALQGQGEPPILLLDEATSQLDAVNESALRETIADVARTTTVLVVAHRLCTVTLADRIVVMDAGRVRAVGSHTELVADDPLYRELAATQFLVSAS